MSFNFMAAVTICSEFGAPKNKVWHCFRCLLELVRHNSCYVSRWCYLTISSFAALFSSCLQSFWASVSFPMSQLFTSGDQSIGASASVLPVNIQEWFPLGLTDWISLQSKGLSRIFQYHRSKHQFFNSQSSLWPTSHIHTWLLEEP